MNRKILTLGIVALLAACSNKGSDSTPDAKQSTLSISATSAPADGTTPLTLSAIIQSDNGVPLQGIAIAISATGSGNTITQPMATDAEGRTSASMVSTVAETKTVSFVASYGTNGTVALGSLQAIFTPVAASSPSAGNSAVSATPTSGVVADGSAASTITVIVRDTNGLAIAGQTVSLAAPGAAVTNPSAVTDATGTATGSIRSTTAGTFVVTATVGSGTSAIVLAQQPSVTFIGDQSTLSASTSTATASPSTGVVANGNAHSTITVAAKDANGNPLAGLTVTLAADGARVVNPAAPTDVNGIAVGQINATTAGTKTVVVTLANATSSVTLAQEPTVAFVADTANLSPSLSTISANPTSGLLADGIATSLITVVVLDANANPVAGQTVTLAAAAANITNPLATTDATGTATGTISATLAGLKTISATVGNGAGAITLTNTATVTFTAPTSTLSATNSTVTANPSSGIAAGGVSTISIVVKDVNGIGVPGETVTLAAPGATATNPAAVTDGNGAATGSITSTLAGTYTVTATVGSGANTLVLAQQPTVSFIGDASKLSASLSTATANPTSGVVANGIATSTITVTVKDINGNVISGQPVSLAAPGATVVQPSTTGSSGTTSGTISSLSAGTKTVTATVGSGTNAIVLSSKPTVGFVGDATNLSASKSTATANPSSGVVANGTSVSTITVVIEDANGNPIPGQTVTLSAPGASVTNPAAATDATGTTTGTITSLSAGSKTVTVTAGSGSNFVTLTSKPTVSFIADSTHLSASGSTITANPLAGVVANGTATSAITVVVNDVNGNPVFGQRVTLATTGATVISPTAATDITGTAVGSVSATSAGSKTITATVGSGANAVTLTNTATVTFIGDANNLSAGGSSATANPTSGVVANGVATSTITVVIKDVNGNPIAGQNVSLTAPGAAVINPSAPTDANGTATGTIAAISAGTKTVTVTAGTGSNNITLTTKPTVAFIGDASMLSATLSTATASPAAGLVANGTDFSTVTVVVKDVNGNPIAGQTVALSSDIALVTTPAATDSTGTTTGTVTSTTAGTATITVTAGTGPGAITLTQQPTVLFVADASNVSAALSTVTANPTSGLTANGTDTSTITVVVTDPNGNALQGESVTLTAPGAIVTQPGAFTDATGTTTGSVTSILAGTITVTAKVGAGASAVVIAQQATITFSADTSHLSASKSTATANPIAGVVANGTAFSTITVVIEDINGNPVAGQPVTLSAPGAFVTNPGSPTDATGTAIGTISSTMAGTKIVTVMAGGESNLITLNQQPTVSFIGDATNLSASNSLVSANPATGVVADGVTKSTITVVVKDGNGNPVAGQTVTLAAANATVTNPIATTDLTGTATGSISSIIAGTTTVTASVGSLSFNQQPTVTFIADASHLSPTLSTATANPTSGVLANGIATSTVTVVVEDVNGNVVPGQRVSLSPGGAMVVSAPPLTDSTGTSSGTIASVSAGPQTISVAVGSGSATVALVEQPVVTFNGDASNLSATNSTVTANPTGGVVANGIAKSVITVTVKDGNGNAVSGVAVTLSATGATATNPIALTDANGMTTGSVSSLTVGTAMVTAMAGSLVIAQQPSVTFVADASHISPTLSTATANPTTGVVANGTATSTITVVVRDVNGNLVSGQTVALTAPGATVVNPLVGTGSDGTATGTISSTTAGVKTVTVTAGSGANLVTLTQQPTVGFNGDASNLSATNSSFLVTGSPAISNGTDAISVSVVLRDINNNLVGGAPVQLSVNGAATTISQPPPTAGDGTTSGSFTSLFGGARTVTITAGTPSITLGTPDVLFLGDPARIDPDKSSMTVDTNSVVADGTSVATATITIKDVNNAAVVGASVQLTTTDQTGNVVVSTPAATDATGQTTGTISSTTAETVTLTAAATGTGAPVTLTQTQDITFTGDANNISTSLSMVSANPTSVPADGSSQSTITVVVLDANSNPVSGQIVTLNTDPSAVVTNPISLTDESGTTTGFVQSSQVNTDNVYAQVGGGETPIMLQRFATVSFFTNALPASQLVFTTPPPSSIAEGATFSVTVALEDMNGVVINDSTDGVQLQLNGSEGTAELDGNSPQDFSNGVATFSGLSIPSSGTFQLVAQGDGFQTDPASITVNAPFEVFNFTSDSAIGAYNDQTVKLSWSVNGTPSSLTLNPGSYDETDNNDFTAAVTAFASATPPDTLAPQTTYTLRGTDTGSSIDAAPLNYAFWAGGSGGTQATQISRVPGGGFIALGSYAGDFSLGDFSLPATNQGSGIFLVSFDSNGNPLWVNSITDTTDSGSTVLPRGVAAFADGSCIVTGSYVISAVVGAADGPIPLSSGTRGSFIARFASDGTPVWANDLATTQGVEVFAIAGTLDGGAIVTGIFSGSATIGSGSNTVSLTGDSDSMFVARYSAFGTLEWASEATSTNVSPSQIASLPDGSSYVTGSLNAPTAFGPGESNAIILVPNGPVDGFIARYNSSGTLAWASTTGGSASTYCASIAVTALPSGDAVIGGNYSGGSLFLGMLPGPASSGFLARLSAATGAVLWAVQQSGTNFAEILAVDAFGDGSIAVGGNFGGNLTAAGGNKEQVSLTSMGTSDAFAGRFNSDGTVSWLENAGAAGNATDTTTVAAMSDGSVISSGNYIGSAIFGPGDPNMTTLPPIDNGGAFFASYLPFTYAMQTITPIGVAWLDLAASDQVAELATLSPLASGGTVAAGIFKGTLALGAGQANQTSLFAANYDLFFAGFGADGKLAWAHNTGGRSSGEFPAIAAAPDGSSVVASAVNAGNSYAFAPLSPIAISSTNNSTLPIVARLNSDGTAAWALAATGLASCGSGGTDMNSAQNTGVAAFRDGSALLSTSIFGCLSFGSMNAYDGDGSTDPQHDQAVIKFDPNGTPLWIARTSHTGPFDQTLPIASTAFDDGSSATVGFLDGTAIDLGDGNAINTTASDEATSEFGYITRHDANGSLLWETTWPIASSSLDTAQINSVAALADGSLIAAGSFQGTGNIGATSINAQDGAGVFVRYDSNGGVLWVHQIIKAAGDSSMAEAFIESVSAAEDGSFALTGSVIGTVYFDDGTPLIGPTSPSEHAFVGRFDSGGNVIWVRSTTGSDNYDLGFGVAAFPDGSVAYAGYNGGAGTFAVGGGEGYATGYTSSGTAGFLGKFYGYPLLPPPQPPPNNLRHPVRRAAAKLARSK